MQEEVNCLYEFRHVKNVLKLIIQTTVDSSWEKEALQSWKIVSVDVTDISSLST